MLKRVLVALASAVVREGDDGKWHLTKPARIFGARALAAASELVKIRGPAGGAPGLAGLDLGAVDLEQLVGVGISMLPKKQQGLAAIVAGIGMPLLKQFNLSSILKPGPKTPATSSSSMVNPLLKDLGQ